MIKRNYKKFIDDEIKKNKNIRYIMLVVSYKDGIIIKYTPQCFEND